MDTSTSVERQHDPHAPSRDSGAAGAHHELGWWRKYVFSTDQKVIGIQYGLTGLIFLFFGFCLMMLMRWQLAYPGQALPVIGKWLPHIDRKSTRLNSSHQIISYAVFCLKKNKTSTAMTVGVFRYTP